MPTAEAPRGKTIDFLIGKQAVDFATPSAVTYLKTYILSHTLNATAPFVDDPVLGLPRTNDRDQTSPAPGLTNLAGQVVAPLDFNHCGIWLDMLFGAAADTGVADPYTHLFTSGSEVLPFSTAEVEVKAPAGNIFMQYVGLVATKLTIDADRTAGYGKLTVDFLGRTENKLGATAGGSPATPWARDPVVQAIGTFQIAGATVANILKCSLTYDNAAKAQEYLGDAAGFISGVDLDSDAKLMGTIQLRFRTTALYDYAVANTAIHGTLLWTKSVGRSLTFDMPAIRLERQGLPIAGPAGIEQNFTFRGEQSSTAAMLTATLKNLVATHT